MEPVLEAVPNLSAGRDPELLDRVVRAIAEAGAEVLDASADADHNRSVVTCIGPPAAVEDAGVATARIAAESIDLGAHEGVHPRVGALDVLPFVPLLGLTIEDARASARRVGERIAREVGVPVFFYADAAEPRGRHLAELRRGGFEALVRGFPEDRRPDIHPENWARPGAHPTAGVTCVGARPLLLAWNVVVDGIPIGEVRRIVAGLRETGGGFEGLRALAFVLPSTSQLQISMNLEDAWSRKPFPVFREIDRRVRSAGGSVVGTEVVGMVPEGLVFDAGADRLSLLHADASRVLAPRLLRHVLRRLSGDAGVLASAVARADGPLPRGTRETAGRLASGLADLARWIGEG